MKALGMLHDTPMYALLHSLLARDKADTPIAHRKNYPRIGGLGEGDSAMTNTARKAEPAVLAVRLPGGETDNDRRTFVNPASVSIVQLVEIDIDGQAVATNLGETPLGTKEIYTQRRMAGDFYCFIHGKRQVSAVGDTLKDAFANALAKAA